MLMVLKGLLGLIGALLLFLGGRWMFAPDKIMAEHGIDARNATGKNFLRGDIGGILVAGAAIIFFFLYTGNPVWATAGIVLITSVILGRVISLMADGKSKQGIQAIVVEVIILALIVGILGTSA